MRFRIEAESSICGDENTNNPQMISIDIESLLRFENSPEQTEYESISLALPAS